jgi:alanyl-tRNA synthetase
LFYDIMGVKDIHPHPRILLDIPRYQPKNGKNMTRKLYLDDTYQFHFESFITKIDKDERGVFITLDASAFYPQGGGQPSDQGIIKNDHFEITVSAVAQINDELRHYTSHLTKDIPLESKIYGLVNQERRLLNARYHSAGHLIGNVVEICYPHLKATKGHSFPKEAYISFAKANPTTQPDTQLDAAHIQDAINTAIARNDKTRVFEMDPKSFEQQFYTLPYSIPEHKKFRVMQIGNMPPVPCGGTHVSFLKELDSVRIGKIKSNNNCVRISYDVA